jgi:ABC-2 type transport system permease protein
MSTIGPIIQREYLTRVRTKGFWISTILVPVILLAAMFVPAIVAARSKARPEPILIVDTVGDFYPVLEVVLTKTRERQQGSPVVLEPTRDRSLDQMRKQLNDRAERGEIQGFVIVDEKALESGQLFYHAKNPSGALDDDWFRNGFREAVTRYRLRKLGLNDADAAKVTERVRLDVRRATNDPKRQESGISAVLVALVLVVFIYSALIMYGMYVMRGVLEEKSNRIVEVIIASVKPFDLMAGKIIGIGAVGLTQLAVWTTFGLVSSAPQLAVAFSISRDMLPKVSMVTLSFFPLFFLLGYFLYATFYAAVGSICNTDEDAQQMAMLPVMLIVFSFVMFGPVIRNPSGTLSVVLSLIPFFSPILMFLRIAVEIPPAWQIGASVVIMLGTTVLMTWLVAKIYRVGILMYGKKPTIPELARWFRYA